MDIEKKLTAFCKFKMLRSNRFLLFKYNKYNPDGFRTTNNGGNERRHEIKE